MKKLFTLLMAVLVSNVSFSQEKPQPTNPVNKEHPLMYKVRQADFEYLSAPDPSGIRKHLKTPTLTTSYIHLPYPIILLHGLKSSSATWDTLGDFFDNQYGFNYGGRFDFCLNYDGNYAMPNLNFYPDTGADLCLFTNPYDTNQIKCGDYYCVNFDVGTDGSVSPATSSPYFVESNQAAVVKQGLALKYVIAYVLQKTGRDKVILLGHSTGGLASREYLQNPYNWQPDGQTHVAKLVTTATPHGGSNMSISALGDSFFSGVDDRSETVRDLRASYHLSGYPGVYLFGGIESSAVMHDMLLYNFYNFDVNCNGAIGDTITGLDQKSIYTDLDYSCIIGECTGCQEEMPGDGIVRDTSANINYYYPNLTTSLFYYYATALTQIHTSLPKQVYQNMQGLDEPNDYSLAYHVGRDTNYMGFTTVQSDTSLYDYDDFKFSIPADCNVTVNINNIYLSDLMAHIVDSADSAVGTIVHSGGGSTINFTQHLSGGDYYLQIYGKPTTSSYLYPYNFIITSDIDGIFPVHSQSDFSIFPNPADNNITIKSTLLCKDEVISIYNIEGELLMQQAMQQAKTTIDIAMLARGMYFIQVKGSKVYKVEKFVKE